MSNTNWVPKLDLELDQEYVGIIELECDNEEYFNTTIVRCGEYLVFGGVTNTGLLEEGNYLINDCFSLDENLAELLADIECALSDGVGSQSNAFNVNARFYDVETGLVYL